MMIRSRRRIFLKVFSSYMVMSLGSLLVISLLYSLLARNILEESKRKTELMLEQVQTAVDNNLSETYAIMYYLESDASLVGVLQLSAEEIAAEVQHDQFQYQRCLHCLP